MCIGPRHGYGWCRGPKVLFIEATPSWEIKVLGEDRDFATVAIRDDECWRIGHCLDIDVAITLMGVASEDPKDWDEMVGCWPRYRTPAVCRKLGSLPIRPVDPAVALEGVRATEKWVVIDLAQKRILTGPGFEELGRDVTLAMVVDGDGNQHCPMGIHLPPWWELHEQVDPCVIELPRQKAIERPRVDRELLYGEPLLADIARRVLDVVMSDRWAQRDQDDPQSRYSFTIEVHRDWLMTPREDLEGGIPREMLHGAIDWMDRLVWSQRLRYEDGGEFCAIPDDFGDHETAPMGREEMVVYFELCRALIEAAWLWCETGDVQAKLKEGQDCNDELISFLSEFKAGWLDSPMQGGAAPRFIIECSRRRVPRGAAVPIIGMSEREPEVEMLDPDCPICQMMAEGEFGAAFAGLDGHQLDIDGEFAFSMCETRAEWEEQQREIEEMTAEVEREMTQAGESREFALDELEPTWSGQVSDEPIPGDVDGILQMAFLLAEIVSLLEQRDATRAEIDKINARFADFRNCSPGKVRETGRRLADHLESLTDPYPDLIPRVADFCSRIDERISVTRSGDDMDIPF